MSKSMYRLDPQGDWEVIGESRQEGLITIRRVPKAQGNAAIAAECIGCYDWKAGQKLLDAVDAKIAAAHERNCDAPSMEEFRKLEQRIAVLETLGALRGQVIPNDYQVGGESVTPGLLPPTFNYEPGRR